MSFICDFRYRGFAMGHRWAVPCGVSYHAGCIRVGEPFRTRLPHGKGLICPSGIKLPHFICELCQVREVLQREAVCDEPDIECLLMERMRMIDWISWWQKSTMTKYGPYLQFLSRFEEWYGAEILRPTTLPHPPNTAGIPLMWAQLLYSLRSHKGYHIKFNTGRMLRSAASMYYTSDLHVAYPGQVHRDRKRELLCDYVIPSEESPATFATKGMARRLGTQTKPSWAITTFMWPTLTKSHVEHMISLQWQWNVMNWCVQLRPTLWLTWDGSAALNSSMPRPTSLPSFPQSTVRSTVSRRTWAPFCWIF
jgi:hypothetical protein